MRPLTASTEELPLLRCSGSHTVALRRIQQRGLRMPDDIAAAVFDGFAYADLFEPQLTTVRQPAFQVGATAAELLTRRIADKSAETSVVRLAPTIEYRASTGPAPAP